MGYQVIITGRNQTKLDQVAIQLGVKAYLADSADLAQLATLGQALQQDGVVLDGVVLHVVFYS